jgi:diguanylate cyclase (GGDEF)-like protein
MAPSLLALAVWILVVAVVGRFGADLGAYQVLPWAFAVGVTGTILGAWAGIVIGGWPERRSCGVAPVGRRDADRPAVPRSSRERCCCRWRSSPSARARPWAGSCSRSSTSTAAPRTSPSTTSSPASSTGAPSSAGSTEWIRDPRRGQAGFAVLFVDLDRFKFVNDTFGHAVGDQLLIAIARLIESHVREGDLVARQGGDEFVVALRGVRDADAAANVASKLVRQLAAPFRVDGKMVSVSASVGVALYPADGADVQAIIQSADAAMYAVKTAGKNSYHFSSQDQRHRQARRLEVERQLRLALQAQEFDVVYQPQLELATGRLCGFEALMRWRNAVLGSVTPAEFIPIAEEAGMIVPVGHWLMREACRQAACLARDRARPDGRDQRVAAAVPPARLPAAGPRGDPGRPRGAGMHRAGGHREHPDRPARARRRHAGPARQDGCAKRPRRLRHRLLLPRLPAEAADPLAQDRPLLRRDLVLGPSGVVGDALPIVEAIAAMGLKLGKTVVAEGVETEAQARYLHRIGVNVAQGFHYAKPMAAAQATALLTRLFGAARSRSRWPLSSATRVPAASGRRPCRPPVPVKLPLPMPATQVARTVTDFVLVFDN